MIGTMLKEYRLRKGFTQKYVAHVLGITSKAYSKIETGVNSLDVSYIVPVCDLLEIPYLNMYAEIFGKLYTDHDDYNNSDNYIFVDGEQRTLSGKPVKNIMTPSEYAIYQLLCTVVGEWCSKQVVLDHVMELTDYRRRYFRMFSCQLCNPLLDIFCLSQYEFRTL